MELPKAGNSYRQERRGIAAVQTYAARTGQIWRETGTGDVGIDGQIEFVSAEGFATGRTVAVQVKAGPSFFKDRTELGWKFYPEDKHKNYWEQFPLPVVLVLHDTDYGASYWIDARQSLRVPRREAQAFIEVPKANRLEVTDATSLFENTGVFNERFLPALEDVLDKLVATTSTEGTFPLSYFDLFVHGLTKICRSIYYGMDVVCNAVEYNLDAQGSEFGMGMGSMEHEFAFGFVRFLLAQNLAEVDYSDCLIDWIDREMQPHFVAPLTSRGRALVALIHRREARMVANGLMADGGGLRVAQEAFFKIDLLSCFARFPRIREFQIASGHEKSDDRSS
ncbi:conserved hypothetical protein (plasmid) [Rhizobium leguminosarum bv. trifolii WSM2304]|uniref:DUF4365 domain-containing protein n=1 Tax=Rhizobium leguminosarum bv. trifolii (strain WSM2304) TaxID=395492 RepID=A0ABF7QV65_RHILW|nr:DUF4365 domain-containing protein [Rhizobium leguminosarum]ACI58168.1 conserved hypothetical protein [Rhizobium leguminosarum bv. trifolii WSM2304]